MIGLKCLDQDVDLVWNENLYYHYAGLEQAFWTIVSQYTKFTEDKLRLIIF